MEKVQLELINQMNKTLDEIRPFLISDGGDVQVVEFENGIAKVKMLGNCQSCNIKQTTIKSGIEEVLKQNFKEVIEVIEVA